MNTEPLDATGNLTISGNLFLSGVTSIDWTPTRCLSIPGADGETAVTLDFDATPPTVRVDPKMTMDDAARQFWNAMARVVGAPEPFTASE